jgi:hypothetical protein
MNARTGPRANGVAFIMTSFRTRSQSRPSDGLAAPCADASGDCEAIMPGLFPPAARPAVLICAEDGAGGLNVDLILPCGHEQRAALPPAEAAHLRRALRRISLFPAPASRADHRD